MIRKKREGIGGGGRERNKRKIKRKKKKWGNTDETRISHEYVDRYLSNVSNHGLFP